VLLRSTSSAVSPAAHNNTPQHKTTTRRRRTSQSLFFLLLGAVVIMSGISRLIRLCDEGDANAQFDLGHLFKFGVGVVQSYSKALMLFVAAAKQVTYLLQGFIVRLF
jgi:TPR repeat protein